MTLLLDPFEIRLNNVNALAKLMSGTVLFTKSMPLVKIKSKPRAGNNALIS